MLPVRWVSIEFCSPQRQVRERSVMRRMFRFFCFLLATLFTAGLLRADGDPMAGMLRRTTSASRIDLCEALINDRRFDQAEALCQWQRRQREETSDDHVKWTTQLAKVLIAQQIEMSQYGDAAIRTATDPIHEWIQRNPSHRRMMFAEQSILDIHRRAMEVMVAMTAVSRHDSDRVRTTIEKLVELRLDFTQLAGRQRDEIAHFQSTRQSALRLIIHDLQTARQRALVASVSLAAMETELFTPGSDDQIASASQAEQLADRTLIQLGASPAAAREVHRIRIQCRILQGRIADARGALDQNNPQGSLSLSPHWLALHVELLIAEKKTREAEQLLSSRGSKSAQTRLARLRWMLATDQFDRASQWIDRIGQRDGLYARRRAEVIALDFGGSASASNRSGLLVHQAHQMIREGDPQAAAILLSRIARQTRDPEQAIRHAAMAAAAFGKVGQTKSAASVLMDVALNHPGNPAEENSAAGQLHLQGLVLESSLPDHDPQQIIDSLREHLEKWATGPSSIPARDWLVQHLRGIHGGLPAAIVQTQTPPALMDQAWSEKTYEIWRSVLRNSNSDDLPKRSQEAMKRLSVDAEANPMGLQTLLHVAGLLMEVHELSKLPSSSNPSSLMQTLVDWRQGRNISMDRIVTLIDSLPVSKREDLRWRLFRDGQANPPSRGRIANFLESVTISDPSTLQSAKQAFWRGDSAAGIRQVKGFLVDHKQTAGRILSAELLSDQQDPEAINEAIALWDRLSSGSPKGSDLWHRAKLAAIELLHQRGDTEAAAKRAAYILVTHPAMDESRKSQYRTYHADKFEPTSVR